MFGIGTGELLVLLVLALLVLGPERMPRLARDIGKTVGDLRRTSDDLRHEFLNADAIINKAAAIGEPAAAAPAAPPQELDAAGLPGGADAAYAPAERIDGPPSEPEATITPADTVEPDAITQADVVEPEPAMTQAEVVVPEPDETAFDKDARLARERLDDPERAARAKAEGWTVPTDEAGTNPERWG
jgi:sec-independent protein translocase protein TatB